MRGAVLLMGWTLAACPAGPDTRRIPLGMAVRELAIGAEPWVWGSLTLDARAVRVRPCAVPDQQVPWPEVGDQAVVPQRALPVPSTSGFLQSPSLLDARSTEVPVGPWCAFDLVVEGPLVGSGAVVTGGSLELEVELPDLGADGDLPFGEPDVQLRQVGGRTVPEVVLTPWIVELGAVDWLAAVRGRLEAGESVVVEPGSAEAQAIGEALVAGAVLVLDRNLDGVVGEDERLAPIAALAPR